MNIKKSYLVHEYSKIGEYIRAVAFDSRVALVAYISDRKLTYDKNKLSNLDDDLLTIKSKEGTGYIEIEEIPNSACIKEVTVDGRKYIPIDEYCFLSNNSKREINKAIREHSLPCFLDVVERKRYVDPNICF